MKYISACELHQWTIETWPRADPHDTTDVTYRCRSWRHAGPCRRWRGAIDFARCQQALLSRANWCHLTLTFFQPADVDPYDLFTTGVVKWAAMRKRIQRAYGDFVYIQTWEIHKSGVPHVHVAISNAKLHADCCDDRMVNFHYHLRAHAVAVGFGKIGSLDPIRSREKMAKYLIKLNNELIGAKAKNQLPLNAPPHFRRLRASRGLLPPPHKNPEITGILIDETTGEILNGKKDVPCERKKKGRMDAAHPGPPCSPGHTTDPSIIDISGALSILF